MFVGQPLLCNFRGCPVAIAGMRDRRGLVLKMNDAQQNAGHMMHRASLRQHELHNLREVAIH